MMSESYNHSLFTFSASSWDPPNLIHTEHKIQSTRFNNATWFLSWSFVAVDSNISFPLLAFESQSFLPPFLMLRSQPSSSVAGRRQWFLTPSKVRVNAYFTFRSIAATMLICLVQYHTNDETGRWIAA